MPNSMRAQATAIYLFVINLIGMGLGPTLVAALTEDVFRDTKAVGYSLFVVGAVAHLLGTVLLWLGLRSYRRSLDYLREYVDRGAGSIQPPARPSPDANR
jgi:hypothetical protein